VTDLRAWLSRPVDAASLHAFRRLFGLLMFVSVIRFAARGWIADIYIDPPIHFPFWGLEWLRPWPGVGMYIHFAALALAALALALARSPRLPALVFFALFTHVELLEQTAYLNHYYLVSLLALLLAFAPAFDRPLAPRWILWSLRLQVGLVYVFAGLAKLRGDWLIDAQPLRTWLAGHADFPLLGPLLRPPRGRPRDELGRRRLRPVRPVPAAPPAHPPVRVPRRASASTRSPACCSRSACSRGSWRAAPSCCSRRPGRASSRASSAPHLSLRTAPHPASAPLASASPRSPSTSRPAAVPLRHHLYPGDVGWTEEGFRYAWHVMLVEKTGMVTYRVRDPPAAAPSSSTPRTRSRPSRPSRWPSRPT
jgi:vitamin K-dependent gamma-carboxylase